MLTFQGNNVLSKIIHIALTHYSTKKSDYVVSKEIYFQKALMVGGEGQKRAKFIPIQVNFLVWKKISLLIMPV